MNIDTKSMKGLQPKLRFPEFKDAKDWQFKQLGDLFTIGNGRDYKHLGTGNVPVYGTGGYMLSVDDYLYDGESVCIGRKGTIDKPLFLSGKFWTVDTLFFTHSFKECTPRFVFSLFQNIDWKKHNEAGGLPSLSKKVIEEIAVYIPEFDEQRKIADCLSSLDDLIGAEGQKLEAQQRHKKGLMQELFPAEGETVPKRRFAEFQDAPEWEEKPLADLIRSVAPPIRLQTKDYAKEGKIPIVDQSPNLVAGWTDNEDAMIDAGFPLIVFGDHTCTLKLVTQPFAQGADGIRIFSGNSELDTVFLLYQLMANPLQMKEYRRHFSILKERKIRYPKFKSGEQERIANCFSSLDENIAAQSQKLDLLRAHKKGLMQGLFPAVGEVEHG